MFLSVLICSNPQPESQLLDHAITHGMTSLYLPHSLNLLICAVPKPSVFLTLSLYSASFPFFWPAPHTYLGVFLTLLGASRALTLLFYFPYKSFIRSVFTAVLKALEQAGTGLSFLYSGAKHVTGTWGWGDIARLLTEALAESRTCEYSPPSSTHPAEPRLLAKAPTRSFLYRV